jgi:hypothetical protein
MGIEAEFAEMMQDTIIVYPQESVDKYGKRAFSGTLQIIPCRLIVESRMTRDRQGREVMESGRAICYGAFTNITTDHKMVLPSGEQPPILSVNSIRDESGQIHHTTIAFGR